MTPTEQFELQVQQNIVSLGEDPALARQTWQWMLDVSRHNYSYNFRWMGRPIIQFPQDMVAVQEIVMAVRPDLIVETGVAHGGSLILSASLMALLDYEDAVREARVLDPKQTCRKVLGIDIDIRPHNRAAIEGHPLSHHIELIQGSSIDANVVGQVQDKARSASTTMVFLDSNHTHEHVLSELRAYAPLVSRGSYCVVFDTGIEDAPKSMFSDRPWGKGNSPKTAVWQYLREADGFVIDKSVEHKIMATVAPDGYLKRVR
jgi:cephalosporin hydroxylase